MKRFLILISLFLLMFVSSCTTPRSVVFLPYNETASQVCNTDNDCALVDRTSTVGRSGCDCPQPRDYSFDQWVAVNASNYSYFAKKHMWTTACYKECPPQPDINLNFTAVCLNHACQKVAK